ncbi:hypothetical protein LQ51_07580 [Micromonospora sp. HK10]|nr:hypothetical protein LQ51_07580 [Micromonospora sp. HK10]
MIGSVASRTATSGPSPSMSPAAARVAKCCSPTASRRGRGASTVASSGRTTSRTSHGVPSVNRRSHGSVRRVSAMCGSRWPYAPIEPGAGWTAATSDGDRANRGPATSMKASCTGGAASASSADATASDERTR